MIIVDFSIVFFLILKNGLKNNMTSKLVQRHLKINNNIVNVIDGFENDIENNNVVDDGVYINEEESVIVDDKDSPINNAVVDIGNFGNDVENNIFFMTILTADLESIRSYIGEYHSIGEFLAIKLY